MASVVPTVKVDLPDEVGVPEITPAFDSESPAGSEPAVSTNTYGPVPPLPLSVSLYGDFDSPFGSVAGVIVMVGQSICSE